MKVVQQRHGLPSTRKWLAFMITEAEKGTHAFSIPNAAT
jgi:hypothetical protein